MADEQTQTRVTAPDLNDMVAFKAAIKGGWNPDETEITPAEAAEEPKPTSEPVPAVAGTEAEAAPAPEAGETVEQPKPEATTELKDEEHGPGWFRRLDKQRKREIREQKDRIAALEQQLAARRIEQPKAEPAAAPVITPARVEPKEEDFPLGTSDPEYIKALTRFHVEEIAEQKAEEKIAAFRRSVDEQLKAEQREAQQQAAAITRQRKENEWAKKVERGIANHPDFEEVVFEQSTIPPEMAEYLIANLDNPDEVAYHLSDKPSEVARIANLPIEQAKRELLRLDLSFEAKPAVQGSPKPNSPPKPKPIEPVGGGSSAAVMDANDPAVLVDFPRWRRMEERNSNRR